MMTELFGDGVCLERAYRRGQIFSFIAIRLVAGHNVAALSSCTKLSEQLLSGQKKCCVENL